MKCDLSFVFQKPYDPDRDQGMLWRTPNPSRKINLQTEWLCSRLGIDDPLDLLLSRRHDNRIDLAKSSPQSVNFINKFCLLFCKKVLCTAFLLLQLALYFFRKYICAKAAREMLIKLTKDNSTRSRRKEAMSVTVEADFGKLEVNQSSDKVE